MSRGGSDRPKPPGALAGGPHSPTGTPVEKIGGYSLIQSGSGQKLTGDTLLLADFILPLEKDDMVADLGSGTGALALLLASRSPVGRVVCVEVQRRLCDIAVENVAVNGLADRVEVVERDFRDLAAIYPEGSFSVVVSNPPYMKAGEGRVSPVTERAISRSEVFGRLGDLIRVSKHLVGKGGRVCYVFPIRRHDEMMGGLYGAGLIPGRIRFIRSGAGKTPKLFLIEAWNGPPLRRGK